ncbi:MAG: hypothetical protein COW66_13020 [Flavobacteriaceae bacterium CG18_big_fil_WC_8_21_14_2_50_34_36]|nr:hypothetical protein [Flavobacteriia bacterium]NCT18055.1 hypothetical protein [Flavobacteriia bacterium]PIQ17188.1 MAG: hypothetical protein COW66_13020 [Flavobacteriaceae bacterium CG18_big_fil_WC_8_21_14_2_50_34_36]PJC08218.1 MAG: hypothetical protein CO068_02215 [Flavobacteriaceae bacterium CG_4_9_14_0_8_um_filter_34_30]
MKKKNLNNLSLNKTVISNFSMKSVTGGSGTYSPCGDFTDSYPTVTDFCNPPSIGACDTVTEPGLGNCPHPK